MTELEQKLNAILQERQEKVLPENIKKGVSIFGVEGDLELNLASGDVKLFETEEDMQNDENAQERDLAILYRNVIQNSNASTEFSILNFPDTVVLPAAVTSSKYGMLECKDSNMWADGNIQLSATQFRFQFYGDADYFTIQYSSTDGIHYTRTDNTGNPIDLGTTMVCYSANEWDDNFGYFMTTGGYYYDGLYEYKIGNDKTKIKPVNLNTFTIEYNDATQRYIGLFSGEYEDYLNITSFKNILDTIITENYNFSGNDNRTFQLLRDDDGYFFAGVSTSAMDTSIIGNFYLTVDSDDNFIGLCYPHNNSTIATNYKLHIYRLNEDLTSYTSSIKDLTTSSNNSTYVTTVALSNLNMVPIQFNTKQDTILLNRFTKLSHSTSICSLECETIYSNKYEPASTQFTVDSPADVLTGKIALGKNGTVIGDGSIYNNLNRDEVFKNLYGLTPSNIDYYSGIDKDTDLILSGFTEEELQKHDYKLIRLKETDFNSTAKCISIPKEHILFSKYQIYEFSDIISEENLHVIVNSGCVGISDDKNTIALIGPYKTNGSYIIDVAEHTVIRTFTAGSVKMYKHKVFYCNNNLDSSDTNLYCYDLNTREESIVTTIPYNSTLNKKEHIINYSGKIITLASHCYKNTSPYDHALNATFIDCDTNEIAQMDEITWTSSDGFASYYGACAANDGVYILAYKRINTPTHKVCIKKCDLDLNIVDILDDITTEGSCPFSSGVTAGYHDDDLLLTMSNGSKYYINLTTGEGNNYNGNFIYISNNNKVFTRVDLEHYYLITGLELNDSLEVLYDDSKFILSLYSGTTISSSFSEGNVHLDINNLIIDYTDNDIKVISYGDLVTDEFLIKPLAEVEDDSYNYIVINLGSINNNVYSRLVPIASKTKESNYVNTISPDEYNKALETAKEIEGSENIDE